MIVHWLVGMFIQQLGVYKLVWSLVLLICFFYLVSGGSGGRGGGGGDRMFRLLANLVSFGISFGFGLVRLVSFCSFG